MNKITSDQIITPELSEGAIINDAYEGFKEDYLVLHCLLRIHQPKSVFEIGTNIGSGTNIICNAVPQAVVYTLDLDYETMRENSKQYPMEEDGRDRVGDVIRFPHIQLRGDSMNFNYAKYPAEAYYIDGEHDYEHAYHESRQAIAQKAKLIIFHDADMPQVYDGITDAFSMPGGEQYELFRVTDTRISYAVRK